MEHADTAQETIRPELINFRITDEHLGEGGPKQKFRANMEAVKLLHELELENRLATPQEQEILSRYVGWGGLSQRLRKETISGRGIYGIIFRTVSRRIPGGEGFYLKCFLYISGCDPCHV